MQLTPAWIEWFHTRHEFQCFQTGNDFEGYATRVLKRFHPGDFHNPTPKGREGDHGCDGIALLGKRLYQSFGSTKTDEASFSSKMASDFDRGLKMWPDVEEFKFVTNRTAGPNNLKKLVEYQVSHAPGSTRVATFEIVEANDFWNDYVSTLKQDDLQRLFPGCPTTQDVEFSHIYKILQSLEADESTKSPGGEEELAEVPPTKMDYNSLTSVTRAELSAGREHAWRIDEWYANADPEERDQHAATFQLKYRQVLKATTASRRIMENLYIALAGNDFRLRDDAFQNAVYAVTAFFFDECDIFERPPDGWTLGDAPAFPSA